MGDRNKTHYESIIREMRLKIRPLRAAIFVGSIVLSLPAYAGSEGDIFVFNVTNQSLDSAINLISEQSNTPAIFSFEKVRHFRANDLNGSYSLGDALKTILAGSDLIATITDEGVIIITPEKPSEPNREDTLNIKSNKSQLIGTVSALASLLAASTASAQTENDNGFRQDEIIVTATKSSQNVQDVPIAITAVTGDALELRDITDLKGVTNLAPNVKFGISGTSSGSGSGAVAFIRGVGQIDFTLVTDPGVGIYIDDVYLARTIGSVLDLVNIDRVEVLRGPQGTLFGRNSTGGAIQVFTKDPSGEFGGSVRALVGEDNRYELSGFVDIPTSDTFSTTLGGFYKHREGTVTDASDRELGDDNVFGFRVKSVWDASDDLSFTFNADVVSEDEGSSAEVPLIRDEDGSVSSDTVTDFTPVEASQGANGTELTSWGVSLTGKYNVTDNLSLKSVTAYRELDAEFNRNPASPTLFHTTDPYTQNQFSQEFQLNTSFGNADFVTGLFYLIENGDNPAFVDVGVSPAFPRIIGATDVENESIAAFGEVTYNFSDRLRAIGGLRYTDEEKSASFISETPLGGARNGAVIDVINFDGSQSLSFDKFTYRGILQYDVTDDAVVYGSYSTGFKSGGFNQRLLAGATVFDAPDSFDEEEVESFEAGVKFQNDTLRANLAAFHSNYTNIQVSGQPPNSIATETFNGGEAKITGVEFEATWTPNQNFLVDFAAGYQDARYTDLGGTGALSLTEDDNLVYTPEFTASLGLSYLHQMGSNGDLRFRGDIFTSDEIHFEPDNSTASFEDGYTTLGLSATYLSPSDYSLTVGVNNVTDEEFLVSGDANTGLGYDVGIFARERNFYVAVKKDF